MQGRYTRQTCARPYISAINILSSRLLHLFTPLHQKFEQLLECLTLQNPTNESSTELAAEQPEQASVFSSDFCFAWEKNYFHYIKFLHSLNSRLIV